MAIMSLTWPNAEMKPLRARSWTRASGTTAVTVLAPIESLPATPAPRSRDLIQSLPSHHQPFVHVEGPELAQSGKELGPPQLFSPLDQPKKAVRQPEIALFTHPPCAENFSFLQECRCRRPEHPSMDGWSQSRQALATPSATGNWGIWRPRDTESRMWLDCRKRTVRQPARSHMLSTWSRLAGCGCESLSQLHLFTSSSSNIVIQSLPRWLKWPGQRPMLEE